jgi:hypothetical protein
VQSYTTSLYALHTLTITCDMINVASIIKTWSHESWNKATDFRENFQMRNLIFHGGENLIYGLLVYDMVWSRRWRQRIRLLFTGDMAVMTT